MFLLDQLQGLLHMLLKLACGPFCGVRNFFIVELNCHIDSCKYLSLRVEEKEQTRLNKLQKKKIHEMKGLSAK
jgi:hypothetical protein